MNRVFKVSEDREIIASEWGDNMNPLVIMLHGGGQTRHSWKGVAAKIANLGFYVIAHDLRGHGESFWDSNGDYTFDAHRDDLVKIIQQLGKKANLVGASLGGMISLSLAGHEEESKHCSGLIMVDIGMRPNDEGSDRIVEFMRSGAKGFASVEEAADAVSGYLPHRERPKDISGLKKNLRLKEDGRYYWHWDPLFLTDRTGMGEVREERFKQLENSAKRITVPTLLVQGALSDILTNKEKEEFLNAVPHAKLAEIQQATHMVVGDKNDIFAEAIVDFLSEQTK
ncbi:MAG: alpha/beta hydrolase [Gammaproteobacteria bacterium]|nr:alpha/beta hydrolase [Gammaproteobacteria bacterium]